ncbi:mitochondrial inner membrane protein Mitofilin [Epithele typhae]|uniref:mitochondrial inner membrane protein Mitofilin n=1 Tax=Epithele typhae TaxID=378194 RepID=UPI0020082D59|nr:mitochondrial inner membrane protein Mitofilin [Epithele typhae]KAH9945073.1 mitochondrial inner membrane protein Mitofilin [Epithele typhae]
MLRALPVSRAVGAPSGRAAVRVVRRRLATETTPTPPKKTKSVVRRLVFYSAAGVTTFYVGSAFVSFQVPQYREIFVGQVPLGSSVVQYAEDHDWDSLSVDDVIEAGANAFVLSKEYFDKLVAMVSGDKAKDALEKTKEKASKAIEQGEAKAKSALRSVKTTVQKAEAEVADKSAKAAAIARHQSVQFSEGVEDLVRAAEAALADKAAGAKPDATTTPEQPAVGGPDAVPPVSETPQDPNVYNLPLPVGFEPPPGYSRPKPPPKPKSVKSETTPPPPAPDPLPLVAPAIAEFSASEPVIAQLATVIDDLASYLNSNPAAADKARDILDTAKIDLTQLATRIEDIKAAEAKKLEASLDEQARECMQSLMDLEMQAQDKLDSQEDSFRKFFEAERANMITEYRQRLQNELQTQSEIINERLNAEVVAQGIELQRRWIREIKMRVEQERGGRLAKLDEIATNLKRLERVALDNSAYLDENLRVHALWSALRAVGHVLDAPERKPFREELRVLRHAAAAREDPVVAAALETLEASDVPDVGIEPLADLTTWFTASVAPHVSSVALVPDQNAGVLSYLASNLFSSFRFQRHGLVEGSDVLSVLARAEYYLNEKDLDTAARELNQLKGPAKVLVSDWLDAARKRLEVIQALQVVETEATLASLLVVQD